MKTDAELKKLVTDELDWDPSINATRVGVAVRGGVVTLTGHLDTYAERSAIERVVERVKGVKAIAVEIDVKLEPLHHRNDTEIAAAAQDALRWHSLVPDGRVLVKVEGGRVTLEGEVDWNYQRESAADAVRNLTGVRGLDNAVTLKARPVPENIVHRIRDAFARHAQRQARHVNVAIHEGVVTLSGSVESLAERQAAFGAALRAPGVVRVVNELEVVQ